MRISEQIELGPQRLGTPRSPVQVVRRSGYLIREGDSSDQCLILVEGLALRNRIVARGERQILGLCVPGDIIDLECLLFNNADHTVVKRRSKGTPDRRRRGTPFRI